MIYWILITNLLKIKQMVINKNKPEEYEPIVVVINPDEHPKVYNAMVESYMKSGMTKAEAIAQMIQPFELELYFDPDSGLFAVEPGAVDSTKIYNPYTKEELVEYND